MASRKQIKAEIAEMENYFDELSEEIIDCKNEIENLKIEKEKTEGEIEIHESRIAYFDLLIRQLCEKFGAEGEEMFREMFPEEAEEILKK